MTKNVTPRSIAALAVVTVSFFLTVCIARYGGTAFTHPNAPESAGWAASMSAWFVGNFGAGLWALVLLPMIWGTIVYFEERTPDLLLRLVGTVLLALSISTLWGLAQGGLWAGHVGNGVAGALGGAEGGLRAVLGWLLSLSLLGVSSLFATDWMFHSLRSAGRATEETQPPQAAEPVTAELLVDAVAPEPREFVVDVPRAAVAAAEMQTIVTTSSDEFVTPTGWDEVEDEGRTVLTAPSGYAGVEFLPQSDELALPVAFAARGAAPAPVLEGDVADGDSVFRDDEFVTTPDAAFFRPSETEIAATDSLEDEDPVVADAVESLFEAVTEPAEEAAAAVGGIGLPDDSPFHDEFFAADAGWPYAQAPGATPSDGASAAREGSSRFTAPPAPQTAAPRPAEIAAFSNDEVFVTDPMVSRLPAAMFDDEVVGAAAFAPPAPPPEPAPETRDEFVAPADEVVVVSASSPLVAPAPQLSLFGAPSVAVAEPVSAAAIATLPEVNLALLHTMELDPLFRDAVAAILERGRASAVVLQRQLGIGYARGIRILDQMTAAGLVGPDTPTGTRQLRVTSDAWAAFTA